eukprot:365968-Chlamydomonas_euryale.AAC.12
MEGRVCQASWIFKMWPAPVACQQEDTECGVDARRHAYHVAILRCVAGQIQGLGAGTHSAVTCRWPQHQQTAFWNSPAFDTSCCLLQLTSIDARAARHTPMHVPMQDRPRRVSSRSSCGEMKRAPVQGWLVSRMSRAARDDAV